MLAPKGRARGEAEEKATRLPAASAGPTSEATATATAKATIARDRRLADPPVVPAPVRVATTTVPTVRRLLPRRRLRP